MSSANYNQPRLRPYATNPAYWPLLIGLGLLWCLCKLPWSLQYALGCGLGNLLFMLGKRRRHIADTNLRACFPELNDKQRIQLTKAHFRSVGVSLFEFGMAWWASDNTLNRLAHVHGMEHLQQALDKGNGVILLSAHFTCLELAGRLLSLFAPFHIMYRANENPVVEYFMQKNRALHFNKAIRRNDVRNMIKSLKGGHAVWYAPDQNFTQKNSVFVDFFNVPAATNTATSRLAKMSGAAVVPFFPIRRADGRSYDLTILPALEDFPGDNPTDDATRINQLIEEQVRLAPEQYLWVHRRFKSRPEGEHDFYR